MSDYQRADFSPLAETIYGIGFHWTTWTCPQSGPKKPFEEAVEAFDVPAFVAQAQACGAGHVMITATHERHWLPGPNPEVDRILPGRTCRRDLMMEIADGLAAADIRFMLYYNHGTWKPPWAPKYVQDPAWQEAVGALDKDRRRYYDNYCRVVGWMGEHYGPKVMAFWMDSGYEHARFSDTPWERFTAAAKAGHPGRLVTYNSGVFSQQCYTPCQDFWAGEVNGINFVPATTRTTPDGLPWYAFCAWACYDDWFQHAAWGLDEKNHDRAWKCPPSQAVVNFITQFRHRKGAVTLNLLCYQDGSAYAGDLETMKGVKAILRSKGAGA